jgi:hypothetical protein
LASRDTSLAGAQRLGAKWSAYIQAPPGFKVG